ncbi:MAG TPA: trypsin-like peptidase domain-containing protein [Mycobacterium sp.]|nr:trypsin-like peptidase domain-containing protein [Mycobacterium sp.]
MLSRKSYALILAASLTSVSINARAAETPNRSELVARELSTVVSISSLHPAHRTPVGPMAASTSGTQGMGSQGSAALAEGVASEVRTYGSGFIIDAGGIIVTNRHVIEGATDILVTLQDNTLLRATLIGEAEQTDIALLKVTPDSPLPFVRFGDSDDLQVADRVLAIGNPLGFGGTVTQGIVSAMNRDISDTPFDDYIQTDAALNHGNSGGPLFDMQGDVIGMNTAIVAPVSSGSIGLGFAIPSNDVKFVIDGLRKPGGMRVGSLDFRIEQITPGIADALNMPKAEGVIVAGTKEGGAAAACGVVAGDVIMKYGDLQVKDVRELARAIARTKPGTVVNLLVWHDEEPRIIVATIKQMPLAATTAPTLAPDGPASVVAPGWHLAPIDESVRQKFSIGSDQNGLVVTDVVPGGPAAEAGVNPGDVLVKVQRANVNSDEDVGRGMELARQEHRRFAALLVHNAGGLRWLALSLD